MGIATRAHVIQNSDKHLFFRDSAAVYSCYPVNNLVGFSEDGSSATGLIVYFLGQGSQVDGAFDFVELTVTSHEEAIKAIMDAINFSKKTVITVADDVNSDYLNASISATDGMNATTNTSQNT
tara:strand:- start:341 stop:709 length:369 start_codon:yes stop_codon:yes gene_type:complete